MLYQKDSKKNCEYKELKCLRLELVNYIICLNNKDAELFEEKCKIQKYKLLSYEDSLLHLKENNHNESIYTINLRERNKKQNNRIHKDDDYDNKEEKNFLNKKRNENNNKKKEVKLKNNSKYIVLEKNSKEYLNGNLIPISEIYKMVKCFYDKMKTKREKKIIPDKIKLSLDEMRTLKLNLKKKIENLGLSQIKDINDKYFNQNQENDKINIDLNKLSQEQLKRLLIDIEELEDLNKYNPNFINYKEELRRRIPDNQKVSQFKIFSRDNNLNHDFDISESDSDSNNNDTMSEKSDLQNKFNDSLENTNNYENLMENFDYFINDDESIKNFNDGLNQKFENLIQEEIENLHKNEIEKEKDNLNDNKKDDIKKESDYLYEIKKERDNLYEIKKENNNIYEIKKERDNLYEIKKENNNLYEIKKENNNLYNLINDDKNNSDSIQKDYFNDDLNNNSIESDIEYDPKSVITLHESDENSNIFNDFHNINFIKNKKNNLNKKFNLNNSNYNNSNNNKNIQLNENVINYISDDETISQE